MSCCAKFLGNSPTDLINYSQAAYSEHLNKYIAHFGGITATEYGDFLGGSTVQALWFPTPNVRTGGFFAGDEVWMLGADGIGSGDPLLGTFEFALHRLQPNTAQSQEYALTPIIQEFGIIGSYGPDLYENRMEGLTVDWSPFEDRLYAATQRIKGHVVSQPSVTGVGTIYRIALDGSYSIVYEESGASFISPTVASDGAVWWAKFSPTEAIYRKPLGGPVQQLTLTGNTGINYGIQMPFTTPFGALIYPANYGIPLGNSYMLVMPDGTTSRRPCNFLGTGVFATHSRDYKKTYFIFNHSIFWIDWATCGSGWSVGGMAMG